MKKKLSTLFALLLLAAFIFGCGGEEKSPAKSTAKRTKTRSADADDGDSSPSEEARPKKFQPIALGGDSGGGPAEKTATKKRIPEEKQAPAVVAALQPFQVLLGDWRWLTKKSFGDFPKNGEDLKWIWDFQTDKNRPALTGGSAGNPYFKQFRLTYLPDDEKFQVTLLPTEGDKRVFEGTWTDGGEPKEESDGKKLQRSYKLQLTQVTPAEGEQWQLTLNQLDNNQYLMDLRKRPPTGKQFGPLDTVRQQRLGTSFAVADSDNPGPKCIISGGLGSMTVTYKGKSYPVCCSGCAAAFNDDPERWLAKLAAKEKAKKSDE